MHPSRGVELYDNLPFPTPVRASRIIWPNLLPTHQTVSASDNSEKNCAMDRTLQTDPFSSCVTVANLVALSQTVCNFHVGGSSVRDMVCRMNASTSPVVMLVSESRSRTSMFGALVVVRNVVALRHTLWT